MKKIKIDETKLPKVMEIIEKAAELMELKDCDNDKEAKEELKELQSQLREVSNNKKIEINEFQAYWSYTDLETATRMALQIPPRKSDLTNEQIKELVLSMSNVEFDEAANDYYLKVLEIETGLDNIVDYIYNPDEIGMKIDVSIEEIIERIIADRK